MKHFKNKSGRRILGLLVMSWLLLTFSASAETAVDDETCLGCHDDMESSLSFTPHRLSSQYDKATTDISCTSCHSGASVHIEDPSTENISNPSNEKGLEAVKTCSACHKAHNSLDNFGTDAHSDMQLNCSSCHKVHGKKKSLLLDDGTKFCLDCHTDVKADFSKRSNHPVKQGVVTCLSCHSFSTQVNDDFSYDSKRACQSCHPDQGGPFMYEHDAANSYMVGGTGCVECHDPHGSENDLLLKQPTNDLCNSCHNTLGHELVHPERSFKSYSCTSCHTDHHGSFVSNLLLDPNMNTKFNVDCYQSGCHTLVK